MRTFILLLISIFSLFIQIQAEEPLLQLGYEAEAFLQAHDYARASAIFESLMKKQLPAWQRDRVLYNLGTIKLAQNQNKAALQYYNAITLTTASTPELIRSLYINKGIAFLNQVQPLVSSAIFSPFDENIALYEESLEQFHKAEVLDCLLREIEEDDLTVPCQTLPDLQAVILKVKTDLKRTKETYRASLNQPIKNNAFSQLLFSYQQLLLEDEITVTSLQALKEQQDQLKKMPPTIFKKANHFLELSLHRLQKAQKIASEFYLIAAFQSLYSLRRVEKTAPAEVLKQTLQFAWKVKKLLLLSSQIEEDPIETITILQEGQQQVLKYAQLFLPAVLVYEEMAFNSKDPHIEHCQQQPWEKVIPLFDAGYQSALFVLKFIKHIPKALFSQSNSINDWQEALKILSQPHPLPQSQSSSSNHNQHQKETDLNATLRLLQEMQAQDEPEPQSSDQEWHTW